MNSPPALTFSRAGRPDQRQRAEDSDTATWSRTFAATVDQVGSARRYLAALLGDTETTRDGITCLSELAANACLHSASAEPGGTFTVRICISPRELRIEVTDNGGPWTPREHSDDYLHGLSIVAALASVSGIEGDELSRTAWAILSNSG